LREERDNLRESEPFRNRYRVHETVTAMQGGENLTPRSAALYEICARLDVAVGVLEPRVQLEEGGRSNEPGFVQ
jgi:hypothetical protein